MFKKMLLGTVLASAMSMSVAAQLSLSVYNPGENSVFPVSSNMISGETEVALIDAQFQKNDAEALVQQIKATGKKLTTVYISHSDPDFYFGLDVIKAAFPEAKIVATPATVKAIKATQAAKVAYWAPMMKENAPNRIVVPEVLPTDYFTVDGERIEVKGLRGPNPAETYLWVPDLKAVVGGVVVYGDNMHVWLADAQTKAARQHWRDTLQSIVALKPEVVVPGHFLPGAAQNLTSVRFTDGYLAKVESLLPKTKNSAELVQGLTRAYPEFAVGDDVALGAKVLKGEMQWP
ncbi:MAG: MBL fold metallo-hydrolase [Neisseriaceae bacterium]|nr:MBL fold metallo-hydrolase [Neisseriaceae bacterium]